MQGALQWLEDNQDKSLEEIQTQAKEAQDEEASALLPGEQPRSLVCNECDKKFRGQSQAEFHASKSGHVDFAESTEEIAPLTEEQKKQRLAELREKLAAKRAVLSEQDKIDKKKNEVRIRGLGPVNLATRGFSLTFLTRKSEGRAPRKAKTQRRILSGSNC